jgi:hypothetical protein
MSIERGPCQTMLKSEFFHFLAKIFFSKKFKHTIGFVLKNAIIGENFVGKSHVVVQKKLTVKSIICVVICTQNIHKL